MAAYTNAALSGQGPWTNSTSTWGAGTGTSATISATALSYTGYGTFPKSTSFQSGDSPGAPFLATAATTGSYYFAFLVKFSVVSTATTNTYGQFFRLRDKAGSASVPARVCAYNLSSGSFKFSVTKNNASNDVAPLTYALSSTHLVIMKYTINPGAADDVVDLFIDPTAGGSEPTPTVSTITGADQFATANQLQGFLIYNGFNSGSSNTSGQMAGFRVGTTWAALFPTCFAPTSVAVSSVTTTTAQLTWGSPSAGTAPTNYDYEINTTGTFTGTPTVSGVSSPVGLTGLMPNTPYYIRVRSNCGGGDFSSWTNTVTFTTLPTCPTPTTPTISNLISTSADLNWSTTVGTGQTTPLSYEYENITSAATFTTVATATGIAASPTTMTASGSAGSTAAMVQATAYKTKVRSNCGSGDFSPYSAQVAYTTTCAVTNLSLGTYTEGFNTPGVLNPCWSTAIVTTGSATDIAVAATMTQPSGTRY